MNEVQAVPSTVEAPKGLRALRPRKFQDPLLQLQVTIPPVPIYA